METGREDRSGNRGQRASEVRKLRRRLMTIREHGGGGGDVAYFMAVSGIYSGRWVRDASVINLGIRHSDLKIGPSE